MHESHDFISPLPSTSFSNNTCSEGSASRISNKSQVLQFPNGTTNDELLFPKIMYFDHLSKTYLNLHPNEIAMGEDGTSTYVSNNPEVTSTIHKGSKIQNAHMDGNVRYRNKVGNEMSPQEELMCLIKEVKSEVKEQTDIIDIVTKEIPIIEIVEEPEVTYRARYESEGCKGPIHGTTENGFPTIKIIGYVGEVVITVFVVTRDNEPHLHTATGPGSSKFACKEVKLPNGVQAIQMTMKPVDKNDEMLAIFDQLSIRRVRNWEADKELRDRGIDPSTWKTKKKEAKLAFQVSITPTKSHPGYVLTSYSRPFQCTAPSGNPEIYWSSHTEGSPIGGQEMGFHGKKFASGFRVRFFSKDDDGRTWEAYADIDRNKSSLHACVFKVPAYFETHLTANVSVYIEIRIGSEKEPRTSEPVLFTYLAESKKTCKSCDQLKGFIQAIHQVFSGRHDLKGIVGSLQKVLKGESDITMTDIQALESNSLEKNTAADISAGVNLPLINHMPDDHKESSIVTGNSSTNGEIQVIHNSEFFSGISTTTAYNEVNTMPKVSAGVFGGVLPSKVSYMQSHLNVQTSDVSSNRLFSPSTVFSQSYGDSLLKTLPEGQSFISSLATTLPAEKCQSDNSPQIKIAHNDNLHSYLNFSDVTNNVNTNTSYLSSDHPSVLQEEKEFCHNSFSMTSMTSNPNFANNLKSLNDYNVAPPSFSRSTDALQHHSSQASSSQLNLAEDIDKDIIMLKNYVQELTKLQKLMQLKQLQYLNVDLEFLEKQSQSACNNFQMYDLHGNPGRLVNSTQGVSEQINNISSGNMHHLQLPPVGQENKSYLHSFKNEQIVFPNTQREENLNEIDSSSFQKYHDKRKEECQQSALEQEFINNLRAFSQGDVYAKVSQLFQPRPLLQSHESSQNQQMQHHELNASFMQHNFPASTNWVHRPVNDVASEHGFYNNVVSNQSFPTTASDRFLEVLKCINKPPDVSSPCRSTFSLGDSNSLVSFDENTRSTSLVGLEQPSFPHNTVFHSENFHENSQIDSSPVVQLNNGVELKSQNCW